MDKKTTIDDLFPSRFLKSSDIGDTDMILTISKVEVEDLGFGDDKKSKPVVYFWENDKVLVLNKTNGETISQLYGKEISEWPDKKIALFTTEVSFQGKPMLGIRIRLQPPKVEVEKTTNSGLEPPANWVE